MPHAIYQTPAFVLKTTNMRESNKLAMLYTRDFGLIYVSAQSIREERSKLKAHLHAHSLVSVDVVRGRDIWRLTGIHEEQSSLQLSSSPWYPLLDRYATSLLRLCPGEEANEELWQDIAKLFALIAQYQHNKTLSKPLISHIEIILMARALDHLGYWSGKEPVIESQEIYNQELANYVQGHKQSLIKNINQGLQRSQL